jgi:hypothetical protein
MAAVSPLKTRRYGMKATRLPALKWKRGRRITSTGGLYYDSECGRYAVYNLDRSKWLDVSQPVWKSFMVKDGMYHVIKTHASRAAAERECNRHKREAQR